MASTDAEAAARTRIVNHMNKDHQRELSHYLRHYSKLPAWRARDPVMKDISTESMTIQSADGAAHQIPFDPPMTSLSEARNRVVAMDGEARAGLGLADVDVTVYAAPRGWHAAVFASVVLYYVVYFSKPWEAGTGSASGPLAGLAEAQRGFWDAVFPGGVQVMGQVVRAILWPVVAIHLVEISVLDRTRLTPHGVRRWSGVWWLWAGSCFFEGYPSFLRFDQLVAEKRAAKEAKGAKGR